MYQAKTTAIKNIQSKEKPTLFKINENDMITILTPLVGNAIERHAVQTTDGYTLDIFRLRRNNAKGIIILQHPFTVSSDIWICQKQDSVGYRLWLEGYDVWMPNNRGTIYGQKHTKYGFNDKELWNFSFHEIGIYDFPACINYIYSQVDEKKIIFVGFSLSTTAAFTYAALKPKEAAEKLKIIVCLGPIVYNKNSKGGTRFLVDNYKQMEWFANYSQRYYMLSQDKWYVQLMLFMTKFYFFTILLIWLACYLLGWTPQEFDKKYVKNIAMAFTHSSKKVIYHYSQICKSEIFRQYDYGEKENLKLYNSIEPPMYPIENIEVPIYFHSTTSDYLSVPQDIDKFYNELPARTKIYGRRISTGFNHCDFVTGKHRFENVWNGFIEFLDKNHLND